MPSVLTLFCTIAVALGAVQLQTVYVLDHWDTLKTPELSVFGQKTFAGFSYLLRAFVTVKIV